MALIDYKVSRITGDGKSSLVFYRVYNGDITTALEYGKDVVRYRRFDVHLEATMEFPSGTSRADITTALNTKLKDEAEKVPLCQPIVEERNATV